MDLPSSAWPKNDIACKLESASYDHAFALRKVGRSGGGLVVEIANDFVEVIPIALQDYEGLAAPIESGKCHDSRDFNEVCPIARIIHGLRFRVDFFA
jgi:hypothetical protein